MGNRETALRNLPGPGPGRPKGSRNKLTEDFIKALADDFGEHGEDAIALVREKKTDSYLMTIAKLIPKEINLTADFTVNIESKDADTL